MATQGAPLVGVNARPPLRKRFLLALKVRASGLQLAWVGTVGLACFAVTALFSRYLFWDSYLDLTGGRFIAKHGIPRHEALTIAAQRTWIDQQWLAHWTYYEAWTLGGYPLVAALSSVLVASAFALVCALLLNRGVPAQRALLWTLLAFVACFGNTVIRAQSFAYPLFVVLLWAILEDARRPRARFLLVLPLLALWSNLHGTVLLAIALVAGYSVVQIFLAARRVDVRLAGLHATVAMGAVMTMFATPYGFSIVHYYRALIGNGIVSQYILEWAPPSLGNVYSLGFFGLAFLVVAAVAYAVGRGYRPAPALIAIASVLGLLATQGVRYQAWFVIAAGVLAAEALAAVRPAPAEFPLRMQRLGALAVLLFALATAVVLGRTTDAKFERLAPLRAASAAAVYATGHPSATILADDETSSALLWLYPQTLGRVAFDARLEQYPQPLLRKWLTYLNGVPPGWPALIGGYDVLVASRRAHPELVANLERLTGWRQLLTDSDGIALVRKRPETSQ
jgi:hypothetical protein